MMKQLARYLFVICFILLIIAVPSNAAGDLDAKLETLATQIVTSVTQNNCSRIAIIEFSDIEGKITALGKFIAEELTTRLFTTQKFEVVERQLLNKVLQEHKLNLTGIIDAGSAKELGKILGVDAVVSGTITDLDKTVKINSRLIATETGTILSVAAVELTKDETIGKLLNKVIAELKPEPSPTPLPSSPTPVPTIAPTDKPVPTPSEPEITTDQRPNGTNPEIASMAAGENHSLALQKDGTVWAWGRNNEGQLGDGTNDSKNTPVRVPDIGRVIAIAAGKNHSLALKDDGTVWAWGENIVGQLGNGSNMGQNRPQPAPGLTGVTAIAAGWNSSAVLKEDGSVLGWGQSPERVIKTPTFITKLPDVKKMSFGRGFLLFLRNDGTICYWGPDQDRPKSPGLKQIPSKGVIGFSSSMIHNIALAANGTVWAWGENNSGQLGIGSQKDQKIPVSVPGINNVIAISVGLGHSAALKNDGTVWTWGDNRAGQLGDGSTINKYDPVPVPGLTGVTAITAGYGHTFALKNDGAIWAWGNNSHGQLGAGLNQPFTTNPVPVRFEGPGGTEEPLGVFDQPHPGKERKKLISANNLEILYQEDFESGRAEGWELEPGWTVERDERSYVLIGSGHSWARFRPSYDWTDYRFNFRFRILDGAFHLNVRVGENGRYFITIGEGDIRISKQYFRPDTFFNDLARSNFFVGPGKWHTVSVMAQGNHIVMAVDDQVRLKFTDRKQKIPLEAGMIALETLPNSHVQFDDPEVVAVPPR